MITVANTHNNLLPDAVQVAARSLIADTERELVLLDKEIARVQVIFDNLHKRRINTAAQLLQCQSTIAPHRKIPNELLSEIFLQCSPDPIVVPWQLKQAPWQLGRVCSKWRQVSLATSKLWGNIQISNASDGTYLPRSVDMGKELFRRSRKSLVSLHADIASVPNSSTATQKFADFIVADVGRMKNMHIVSHLWRIQPFLSLPPGSIDSLESLTIKTVDDDEKIHSLSVFRGARNLHQVSFNCTLASTASLFDLPLSNLTTISIPYARLRPNVALAILNECSSLVDCTIGVGCIPLQPAVQPQAHLLPSLKRLHIRDEGPAHCIMWIRDLVMPVLVDFKLSVTTWALQWPAACTTAITRSGTLESLKLFVPVSAPELEVILEASPALAQLEIPDGAMMTPLALQKMARGEMAPQLSIFTCAIDTMSDLDLHLDMLESRRDPSNTAAHMKDVVFRARGPFAWSMDRSAPPMRRLSAMAETGWNITFY